MGLLDKLGVGGGKLTISPAALHVHAGTALTGKIVFAGGSRVQPITKIVARVQCSVAERGADGQNQQRTVDVCPDQVVAQAFSSQPGQEHAFPFSFALPSGIFASRQGEVNYRITASADIPGEVDPGAFAEFTVLASEATAAPAAREQEWRPISKEGEWQNSRAMVAHMGRLYIAHGNGKLYVVKPDGSYSQLGESSGWNTRLMASTVLTQRLWLVEESGKLYEVDAQSGAWAEHGSDGEWTSTTSLVGMRDTLFASTPGKLWAYAPMSGWRQVGELDTWRTRSLLGGNELIAVEESTSLFAVRPEDGAYRNLGTPSQWGGIQAITAEGPHVYANMSSGGLYRLDTTTGVWSQVGTSMNWNSFALVATGGLLFSLERSGTLFVVQGRQ